jgi:RNA polymerase sigma-70 factor (ECF subfamily)
MGLMADQIAAAAAGVEPVGDFSAWMRTEQRRVFLLCQRMLGEADEADSATQDIFLKAYKSMYLEGQRPDDPARWLTRVAVNACLDKLRSRRWQFWRKRPAAADEALILAMTPSGVPDAEREMFSKEIAARLGEALDKLSARQRAVFALRHYEEKSLDEIGALLDLDTGTVKAHMARALAKLRDELKDLYQPRKLR